MIDTHTHLYSPDFTADTRIPGISGQVAAVDRAVAAGVKMMLLPAISYGSIGSMKQLAAARPDNVRLAVGLHPTELGDDWRAELDAVLDELRADGCYVAVGECGIDLYWDASHVDAQMQVFDAQVAEAVKMNLPVLIHCRNGLDQTLEVLEGHHGVRAVFHSFGGSAADVDRICRAGDFYFGINGIVTFKNSGLRDVLPHISPDRMLTETDSPYLAPVPNRGKRNESAMLPFIVETMALAMGVDKERMSALTEANALAFIPRLEAEY